MKLKTKYEKAKIFVTGDFILKFRIGPKLEVSVYKFCIDTDQ